MLLCDLHHEECSADLRRPRGSKLGLRQASNKYRVALCLLNQLPAILPVHAGLPEWAACSNCYSITASQLCIRGSNSSNMFNSYDDVVYSLLQQGPT